MNVEKTEEMTAIEADRKTLERIVTRAERLMPGATAELPRKGRREAVGAKLGAVAAMLNCLMGAITRAEKLATRLRDENYRQAQARRLLSHQASSRCGAWKGQLRATWRSARAVVAVDSGLAPAGQASLLADLSAVMRQQDWYAAEYKLACAAAADVNSVIERVRGNRAAMRCGPATYPRGARMLLTGLRNWLRRDERAEAGGRPDSDAWLGVVCDPVDPRAWQRALPIPDRGGRMPSLGDERAERVRLNRQAPTLREQCRARVERRLRRSEIPGLEAVRLVGAGQIDLDRAPLFGAMRAARPAWSRWVERTVGGVDLPGPEFAPTGAPAVHAVTQGVTVYSLPAVWQQWATRSGYRSRDLGGVKQGGTVYVWADTSRDTDTVHASCYHATDGESADDIATALAARLAPPSERELMQRARNEQQREQARKMRRQDRADLLRRLRRLPAITRKDSYSAGNCRPGTEDFVRAVGVVGDAVTGRELATRWRAADYTDEPLFTRAVLAAERQVN